MSSNNSNETLPLITIGVSAYNRKNYLPQSLDSLLNQTYPNIEIIVVDDGSTDGTAELMRSRYPQVKYVYQENAGDAAAKNHAAELASGEYIVFNDSDDLFYPDAVERLYNALDPADKNSCSYGTYQTIDANGNEMPTKRKLAVYPSGDITKELCKHIIINNCGTLIPRKMFFEAGPLNPALRVSYDWALFLEMSTKSKFHAVQEPVFLRRRHGSNISSATCDKEMIVLAVFENFLACHPEVAERFPDVVSKRYGALHRKVYREALKEKRFQEAKVHAGKAFHFEKNVKNLFAYLSCLLKG